MTGEKSEPRNDTKDITHPETMNPEDFEELMKERTRVRFRREGFKLN